MPTKKKSAEGNFTFKMLKFLLVLTCFFINSSAVVYAADPIAITSTFNPVGSGARAIGMGGAFIAVADDATAASWNPGGLVQLERPEVSLVLDYFYLNEDNNFQNNPEASGGESSDDTSLNYFSLAYPFTLLNRNMIVSLNYQKLFDFKRGWDFPLEESGQFATEKQSVQIHQNGAIYALGFAYCIELMPRFSFGFTLNFWEDLFNENEWKVTVKQKGKTILNFGPEFDFFSERHEKVSFSGFNSNVGILWGFSDRLTFGAVLKTPFTADLDKKVFFRSDTVGESLRNDDEELDMPIAYGVGFAYRFSDSFTVSGDVTRTEWSDFVRRDSSGVESSPLSGRPINKVNLKDTHQVRVGGEYIFIRDRYAVPFRAGVFYDPAPSDDGVDDFYGLSLGSGIAYDRLVLDIAYQYRFGNDVRSYLMDPDFDFSQDVQEHAFYASLIFYF